MDYFLNQFSVQLLSRNGDGPDWSLIKELDIVKFYLCSLLSIPAGEKLIIFTDVFDRMRTIRQNTSWLYSDIAKSDYIYRHHKAAYITSSGLSTVSTTYTSKWRSSQLTSGSTGRGLLSLSRRKSLKKPLGPGYICSCISLNMCMY